MADGTTGKKPTVGKQGVPLGIAQREALSKLVRQMGERDAICFTGLSRHTLARALAGLGLRSATAFMVTERLAAPR